jgi:uncharacterized membrane protein YjjP (DUF1212 family)
LILYGAPTHRLEEYMAMSAKVLEIPGQFLYLPACMVISFEDEVKIVRETQGMDMGRMCDVHNVYKMVLDDHIGVDDARGRLDEIMGRAPRCQVWMRILLYGVASLFIDLPIAFLLGAILGFMHLVLAPRNVFFAHVFEVLASIVTSFLARFFGSLMGGNLFCFSSLAQSSIALILPGFPIVCAALELQVSASRHFSFLCPFLFSWKDHKPWFPRSEDNSISRFFFPVLA